MHEGFFEPDFGPNVFIFDPAQSDAQALINAIFKEQESAEFGSGRFAFLFKPGRYELDVPVGFYTQVAGLGASPSDVRIMGRIWTDAAWKDHNATCNFWRSIENLTIEPAQGVNMWAVSQAAPLRRLHIKGDLHLSSSGWSSGGFMADCKIDGIVIAGSQQQWFSRNSEWKQWHGVNWNKVFLGCENPPDGQWPQKGVTVLLHPSDIRGRPFLACEHGQWSVQIPPRYAPSMSGARWTKPNSLLAQSVPIEEFYIAKAGIDTAATINAALKRGKHLLITPGIYGLDETIMVNRPATIILGMGFPSLVPTNGKAALRIEAPEGTIVSGIIVDASECEADTLVEFGFAGRKAGSAEKPTYVHDLVCRVGGYGIGKARLMVAIYDDHLVGENFWLWRADHGAGIGWDINTCDTALLVEGDDVTLYGLFAEHTQKHQTIWNGERGRTFFYQSEMPYDPPSRDAWQSPSGDGYASYKVGGHVKTHAAWALGVYHVFHNEGVVAENAIETPELPGIQIHHAFTFRLANERTAIGIRHVLNGRGEETATSPKTVPAHSA